MARGVIRRVLEDLPADATDAQRQRAVSEAYPFGPREHHPYKMWLAEARIGVEADRGVPVYRAEFLPVKEGAADGQV